jgi:hypothetical protein
MIDDTGQWWEDVTPWEAWFAWRPVKLKRTNKYVWFKDIYRRINTTRTDYDGNRRTEYGDVFDVLRL